jgi:Amt family ammonium transporter
MQLGFAFLENGLIRKKNSHHQNFMNVASTAIEVIIRWLWGYGLAYGYDKQNDSGFGESLAPAYATSHFETIEVNQYPIWIFQFAFCGTATTIISGRVCERATMVSFLICAVINTGFIYPIVAYWVWCGGWL